MLMRGVMLTMMLAGVLALYVPVHAQGSLTAQDRAEMQGLTASYARALGACAAEEYADLFAPGTGYFASNIRGEVAGRERLMALVRSERHCTGATPPQGIGAAGAPAAPRPVPTVAIELSPAGPIGRADLGTAGQYDDEYVKTSTGWRFKSRTVVSRQELAVNLTGQDMRAIRRLAGTDLGQFEDVYVAGADGVWRFRASGVALGLSADGVTGRANLKQNGGHYEDVFVKTPEGMWRFQSRVHVAAAKTAAGAAAGAGQAPQPASLTALDYFEIQQLVSKYARAIDTCSNNGYDYADLFTADGFFAPAQNGKVGNKMQGRERLAEASGGGSRGCKNVGWIRQGVKHLYVNHIITPTATGATGTVDMLMIGLGGDPNRIRHEGYYEDAYVRTSNGWRFASRIHHVPEGGTTGQSGRGGQPGQPAAPAPER